MTDSLVVGLSSWIIQDGNYDDFSRGDRAAFALEFYSSKELAEIDPSQLLPFRWVSLGSEVQSLGAESKAADAATALF